LVLLVVVLTHWPLHSVKPLSQAKEQALFTHAAVALATLVVQVWPQVPQLWGSFVVLAHPLAQSVSPEQPDAQA
jgi:hypothetical protein